MQTRRLFLKQTSIAAAGLIIPYEKLVNFNSQLIGLQLYTLRNQLPKDPEGTIAKVAEIGYNSVEVFGYSAGKFFGKTVDEFSAIIKKNHLVTPSGHYMMSDYLSKGDERDLKSSIEAAAKMGHKFIVVPFLFDNMRTSLDDYKRLAAKFNVAAVEAKKSGLKFAYHNHNFEFKDWGGGQTGFNVFLKETDPALVNFEMDIYWVVKAGQDPIRIMRENPGRIKLWHVKDMSSKTAPVYSLDGEQQFTEVGSGIIDYPAIFKHRKEAGLEYFYVEQDQTHIPVFESIEKSLKYMKKLAG